MPRFFKPLGGFDDKRIKAVQINDDGDSFHVMNEGEPVRTGYVSADHRWMPDRQIGEMENLVRGGGWMEVKAPDDDVRIPISPSAAPPSQTAQRPPSPASGPVVTNAPGTPAPSPTGAAPIKAEDANKPNANAKE